MESKERRIFNGSEFAVETRADGKDYLTAYGIVFNQRSRFMGFYEQIDPAVLEGCDVSEVICKFNHDINQPLGTSWARTLTWEVDEKGVKYSVQLPNTELGRSIKELVNRGDLRDSSFEFEVAPGGAEWRVDTSEDGTQYEVRQINKIKKLWDLSPVMVGAYKGTGQEGMTVAKREYDEFKNKREQQIQDEAQAVETIEAPAEFQLSAADEIALNGW